LFTSPKSVDFVSFCNPGLSLPFRAWLLSLPTPANVPSLGRPALNRPPIVRLLEDGSVDPIKCRRSPGSGDKAAARAPPHTEPHPSAPPVVEASWPSARNSRATGKGAENKKSRARKSGKNECHKSRT